MFKEKSDLASATKNPTVHSHGFIVCFLSIHTSKRNWFGVNHVLGPAFIKLVFFPFSCCIEFCYSSVICYCKNSQEMGRQDLNFERSVGASVEESQSLLYFQPVRRPHLGGRDEGSLALNLKLHCPPQNENWHCFQDLFLSFYSK